MGWTKERILEVGQINKWENENNYEYLGAVEDLKEGREAIVELFDIIDVTIAL